MPLGLNSLGLAIFEPLIVFGPLLETFFQVGMYLKWCLMKFSGVFQVPKFVSFFFLVFYIILCINKGLNKKNNNYKIKFINSWLDDRGKES